MAKYDPDHIGCCIAPDFIDVPDGSYTHQVILDEPIVAGYVCGATSVASHIERLPTPLNKTRKELVWVEL